MVFYVYVYNIYNGVHTGFTFYFYIYILHFVVNVLAWCNASGTSAQIPLLDKQKDQVPSPTNLEERQRGQSSI